jgi:hypothetical protein
MFLVGVLKVKDEKNRILIRIHWSEVRIGIRTKMSRIHNTDFYLLFLAEAEVEAAVAEVETAAPPADEVVDMDTTPDPSSTPAIQPALPTTDPCTDDKIEEKERTTTPEPPPSVVLSEIVVAEDASTEEEKETLKKDSDEVGVEKPESSDAESLSKPAIKSDVVGEDETKKVAQEEKEEEVLLV